MSPRPSIDPRNAALVGLLGFLLQGLLVLNPGYFSHDELQWGAFADVAHWTELPWVAWTAIDTFQYRPLTFNTWLLVSHALFEQPQAFHAVIVGLGTLNGVLLCLLLQRLGVAALPAAAAALLFLLGPYSAYVHGWVATLADLLWLGLGLALAHYLVGVWRDERTGPRVALVALALTTLALLAKEAAVALPALVGLAWLLARRPRSLGWALAGSAVPVAAYLALRLSVLLLQPRSSYGLSWQSLPQRWSEYFLFLPHPTGFEVANVWLASPRALVVIAVLWLLLLLALGRAVPRLALWLLGGTTLALGPVLILAFSSNQYGYGFAAVLVSALALAWPALGRPSRALVGLLALLVLWHGANVQRQMLRVGRLQAVFQPALVEALSAHPGVLRLRLPAEDDWVYRRLTHEIPAYRGVAIDERLQLVEAGAAADYAIAADGRLQPAD